MVTFISLKILKTHNNRFNKVEQSKRTLIHKNTVDTLNLYPNCWSKEKNKHEFEK